ncbi:hypothetical protein F5Y13DRAFT_177796 [Hypoxylon sp. FL1857]|nr:hypothetical protein F5Y13DRAFT_177796 [Hypoxylon sp. FL1857]
MRAAQAMKASKASRARAHANALGLSIHTGSASCDSNSSSATGSQHGDTFTQIATAPAKQRQFKASDKKALALKESEALANPDWRTNRRAAPRVSRGAPFTAGLENTEFHKASGHPPKKVAIDTSPESLYGVRRYRITPIDPDFIHSAPITKKDFGPHSEDLDSEYHVQDDEDEETLDTSDIVEQTMDLPDNDPTAQMSVVKLEPLSSTAVNGLKAGLDYRQLSLERQLQEDGKWADKWSCNNIPLMASPVEPSCVQSTHDLNFPLASVKAIKEPQRFKDRDWNEVPRGVVKNLTKFAVPLTAGLPPDRLRQAYDRSQRALDTTEDPATEQGDGYEGPDLTPEESKQQFEKDQARFEALIGKLHKSAAHRLRGLAIDIKPPHWPEKGKSRVKESSMDSGVGDLNSEPGMSAKLAPTLNPLASEFHFSSQGVGNPTGQIGYLPGHQKDITLNATSHDVSPSMGSRSTEKQAVTAEDIQTILKSMNELKMEITQLRAAPQQPTSLQTLTLQKQLDYMESLADQIHQGMHAPTQPTQAALEYGFGQGAYSGVQPYGSYAPSQQQYGQTSAVAQPSQYSAYGTYNAGPGYNNGASFNVPGYTGPSHGGATYNGAGLNGTGFNGPSHGGPNYNGLGFNVQGSSMPSYNLSGPQLQYPVAPILGPQSLAGPPNLGPLPLHAQAQMAFGPKPVRKPRGPPRPGNLRATQQQQDYEQYLEVRRATDPEFARECKERQARRAGRQRAARGY